MLSQVQMNDAAMASMATLVYVQEHIFYHPTNSEDSGVITPNDYQGEWHALRIYTVLSCESIYLN